MMIMDKFYFKRTSAEIELAIHLFCNYHALMETHVAQGRIRSSLDRGAFVRPHDVLSNDVLAFLGEKRNSRSFAYGMEYGDHLLREKIAELENLKHSTSYTAENVAIMPGAWAGLEFVLMEIFHLKKGNRDDGHVAIIGPTLYHMCDYLITSLGFDVMAYDFVNPNTKHIPTKDEIDEIILEKPKAIIITNPNNPDGIYFPSDLLKYVIKRAQAEHIFVVIDEIQNEFPKESHGLHYSSWIQSPYVVRIDSPSKRYALPEYRVGWVIVDPILVGNRTSGIVGRMSGFMGNAPRAANSALIYLHEKEIEAKKNGTNLFEEKSKELKKKETYVVACLEKLSEVKNIFPRDACINRAVQFDYQGTDMQLAERLMNAGTLLMPASGYGYRPEDCVMRITFAEREEKLEHSMKTLELVLKSQP